MGSPRGGRGAPARLSVGQDGRPPRSPPCGKACPRRALPSLRLAAATSTRARGDAAARPQRWRQPLRQRPQARSHHAQARRPRVPPRRPPRWPEAAGLRGARAGSAARRGGAAACRGDTDGRGWQKEGDSRGKQRGSAAPAQGAAAGGTGSAGGGAGHMVNLTWLNCSSLFRR